ncbi:hypothetical protein [Sphingomonas montanisoli]|uniref:Glycosyltransferase RgtA/B/C/D-like domain-containing protein n=1 Tax=Sphingomonas montanisoli TaxID=2606412 RepID=A0A5D9C8G5_9SPHN|nr:hypothetical protein [Sphingomonas montanisoli]TZG28019.1 hypothetical protein FYJ91_10835 [Sphingomonas montanisoli]
MIEKTDDIGGFDRFKLACAALGLIGYAIGLWHVHRIWPTSDQAIFDYVAFIGANGGMYYRDAFDISWPIPFLYHAAGQAIFGVHPWTFRVFDMAVLMPIGLTAMAWLLKRCGFARAPWIVLATYPILYATSGAWISGHRDITAMHLLILAAALMIDRPSPSRRGLAGFVLMIATFIRPTYLFAALPLWLIDLRAAPASFRLRMTAGLIAGGIAVAFAFLMAGLQLGTIGDWYEQAVLFPATRYQVDQGRMRLIGDFITIVASHWRWPFVVAVGGAALWGMDKARRSRFGLTLAALILTVIVSFFVQNKGFPYHLSGFVPLMLLSTAAGIDAGWSRLREARGALRAALTMMMLIAGGGLAMGSGARAVGPLLAWNPPISQVEIDRRTIAGIIRSESRPDEPILQWGRRYDVAVLSERLSASRYINSQLIARLSADDRLFAPWIGTFRHELAARAPVFMIIDRDQMPGRPDRLPLPVSVRPTPAVATFVALANRNYTVRALTPEILLLKHR